MENKRGPGRPPGKTLPRQINVYVTPGIVDEIKSVLKAGETMSGLIRSAIETEITRRGLAAEGLIKQCLLSR